MNTKELKELQNISTEILNEFHNFCVKNKLKYSLGEGTLLGAIRHRGFIPWDDDIDVYMLRDDFDKFIKLYKSEKYFLEYFNTNEKYWLSFAKLKIIERTKFIIPNILHLTKYNGPRIDIMPIDYVKNINSKKTRLIMKKSKIYKKLLYYKAIGYAGRKIKFKILNIFSKVLSYRFIVEKLNFYMKYYNDESNECNYLVNYTSSYSIKKETFDKNYFKEYMTVPFEKYNFNISKYYHNILTQIYGDYMTLPPKEKRKIKHDIIVDKRGCNNEK